MGSLALACVLTVATIAGALAPADPIRGTVRTSAGVPITGALVELHHAGGNIENTTTGSDGTFAFANAALPAVIKISARGYLTLKTTVSSTAVEAVLAAADVRESVVVMAASPGSEYLPSPRAIGADEIAALPAVAPDETLRAVAGFSLFRRSSARASNPTTHGVTMRGLSASGASRGLVLLDGIPLNEGFGGWVTWTRVPMFALEEIEIERGAAGDTFGSDALGGVFELKAGLASDAGARVLAEGGSNGVAGVDAGAGRRYGQVSIFGAGSWFRTDGVVPLAPESRGDVDARADAEWFNALGKAVANVGGNRLTISGWGSRDDRGNGTRLQRNRMTGGTLAAALSRASDRGHLAARLSVSPNSFDQTFSAVAASRATETLTSTQRVESTVVRGVFEYSRLLREAVVIARAGLSRASADFVDVRATSAVDQSLDDNSESVSLHAGLTPAARFSVAGGVRHEWRAAPASDVGRDSATVGQASASWQATSAVLVRGTVASSHRWPTLNELVRNFQVGAILTLANPNLKPERARSADVSVSLTQPRWTAGATVFTSVVHDAISNVTQTPTRRQRQNAGDANATGVEIEAGLRPVDALRIRVSAAFTDATFQNAAEPALEGRRLPQVPRAAIAVGVDAALPMSLRASALWRSTGAQFDDDRNVFELASASQLDLQLAGMIAPFTWRLVVENAADARVEVGRTPLVTLAPGRAVRIGVGVRF
jgi:outer membrane receptor protein involved in Fe transport